MARNKDYWLFGSYNVICDVCGQKYKAGELKLRWDGLRVCHRDWEPRHPQDFVRGVPDNQSPPWTKPEQADEFVQVFLCTGNGQTGVPGYAVAGCAVPRYISPLFVPNPPFNYQEPNN